MSDCITEQECSDRRAPIHGRINQRVPWFLFIPLVVALSGGVVGAYKYTHSVELAQKELVMKSDLAELKRDLKDSYKGDLEKIHLQIQSIGK